LKRREKADRGERERFAKNMAGMMGNGAAEPSAISTEDTQVGGELSSVSGPRPPPTAQRWAALRGFIAQTLEQKE